MANALTVIIPEAMAIANARPSSGSIFSFTRRKSAAISGALTLQISARVDEGSRALAESFDRPRERVNPAKCPKWSIRQSPRSEYVSPVGSFACR